jgi:ligand-binding sensor domain-containing protein
MGHAFLTSIPDNRTYRIITDKSGDLWFGTANGVYRYNTTTGVFSAENEGLSYRSVSFLIEGQNGTIWAVATSDSNQLIHFSGLFRYTNRHGEEVYSDRGGGFTLASNPQGEILWLRGNTLYSTDGAEIKSVDLREFFTDATPTDIKIAQDGTIWIGAQGKVFRFMEKNCDSFSLGTSDINLQIDAENIVWAMSQKRLYRYSDTVWKEYPLLFPLAISRINTFTIESDGAILVATPEGLFRFDNGVSKPFTIQARLPSNIDVRFLETDNRGNLWTASINGLVFFNGK